MARAAVVVVVVALSACGDAAVPRADSAEVAEVAEVADVADDWPVADASQSDSGAPDTIAPDTADAVACLAPGAPCGGADACCAGACAALGVCVQATCGVAAATCVDDADCCSQTCRAGRCLAAHVAALAEDRERLLDTLARRLGSADRCAAWAALDAGQRGVFLTHTDMLGNRTCMDGAAITSGALDAAGRCDPSVNPCACAPGSDMALDHVLALWTVNGDDPTCACADRTADGKHCCNGGGEWHRIFFTADDELIARLRGAAADPSALAASGLPEWRASEDLGGPHAPFDVSDETELGPPRGQTQLFGADADAVVLARVGVEGVFEPHIVELDNDYNLLHDSSPEGCYGIGGALCTYGRVRYAERWRASGNHAPTTLRANGEPGTHSELAGDEVYAPRCPTAHVQGIGGPLRPGAVVTVTGLGFVPGADAVHVRGRSAEVVLAPGSPFILSETPTALRLQLPAETTPGPADVWVRVDGLATAPLAVTITP